MVCLKEIPSLIVYDFDGVMTDNRALIDENGVEYAFVNRSDGYGVRMIKEEIGIPQVIISTEINPIVIRRADKLGIPVINGVKKKEETLVSYCRENNFDLRTVFYIGNDLNDYAAMQMCGIKGCPADAEKEIKDISDIIVFSAKGGYGVVRELYRILEKYKNEQ